MQNSKITSVDLYTNIVKVWGFILAQKKLVKPRFWLLMMAVLVLVFVGFYTSQSGYMARQQAQIALLEAQRDEIVAENAMLERKIAFSKTDEYIERTAREDLGLLKPGEVRFVAGVDGQS